MLIYLAARFSRRFELQGYRAELARAGHRISSRWIDQAEDATDGPDAATVARRDIADIEIADTLIAFTVSLRGGPPSRGSSFRRV